MSRKSIGVHQERVLVQTDKLPYREATVSQSPQTSTSRTSKPLNQVFPPRRTLPGLSSNSDALLLHYAPTTTLLHHNTSLTLRPLKFLLPNLLLQLHPNRRGA